MTADRAGAIFSLFAKQVQNAVGVGQMRSIRAEHLLIDLILFNISSFATRPLLQS